MIIRTSAVAILVGATLASGLAFAHAQTSHEATRFGASVPLHLPGTSDLLSGRTTPRTGADRTGIVNFMIGSILPHPGRRLIVTEAAGVRTARLVTETGKTVWQYSLEDNAAMIADERTGEVYTAYLITTGSTYAAFDGEGATFGTSVEQSSAMTEGLDVRVSAVTWSGVPRSYQPHVSVNASDGPVAGLGATAEATTPSQTP